MSSLLYYLISSDLTKDEIIKIDRRVAKEREAIYLFFRELPSNSKSKVKRIGLYTIFIFTLSQPLVPCAAAVILSLPPAIGRLLPIKEIKANKNYTEIANIPASKFDKIKLTKEQIKQLTNLALELNIGSIKIEEAILQLRGSDGLTYVITILAFVIFLNWYDLLFGAQAFQANPLPHQDLFGWLSGKYNSENVAPSSSRPTTYLEMEKPTSMPQQEHSSMTKSERRQLPDPIGRDKSINVDDYPRLDLRFNQIEYKTPKHGKDHGLPVDKTRKTTKTESNVIALRDSLIDMANNQNIIWYTDGQYQGGTQRGCDSVNLFDRNTNVIAVYQKQRDGSCLFLTTCKLVPAKVTHLKDSNGNFLTEVMINQQNAISTKIHDSKNTKNDL